MKKKKQENLFDIEFPWQEHWENMPEFIQDDLTSHRKIIVHFRNDDDVKIFAELIGQKITSKQLSLWFPYLEPKGYSNFIYIDEP